MKVVVDRQHLAVVGWLLAAAAITVVGGCGNPFVEPVQFAFQVLPSRLADCDYGDAELRFYVSDLAMIDTTGAAVPVRLDAASRWQNQSTALISLATGCAETVASANRTVSGSVARGRYDALEFSLGVSFEHNHVNPMKAAPPLNVPSMFWTWQTGYKFLRLDLGNRWSFHLGSTGCVSDSVMRPPRQACRQPNVARIRLEGGVDRGGTVLVDLDALLAGIDPADAGNCVARYRERGECRRLLATLGLDADTGHCIDDCADQSVFRFDSR